MALTLVKEDGTGKSTANSYANTTDGDSYHDGHLYATNWTGASTANKEAALVMATRLMDDLLVYQGTKATDAQALQWPRHAVKDKAGYSIDSNEVPTEIVNATCEFARWLLASDRTAEDDTKGYTSMRVGSLGLTIDKNDRKPIIPSVVVAMIGPLSIAINSGGSGTVGLLRV